MPLLLDTQIIIWLEERPANITTEVRNEILAESNVFFSKASVWEMTIKIKTGKLTLKQNLSLFIKIIFKPIMFFNCLIFLYPISIKLSSYNFIIAILLTGCLSLNQLSNIAVISSDGIFDAYGIQRIW